MRARPHLLLIFLLLTGCNGQGARVPEYELTGQSMGTTYSIKLVGPAENLDREALGTNLAEELRSIEARLSTYMPESELSQFNASNSTDWVTVSDELCELIDAALAISKRTDGAFDVTIGPLVNLWGFGPDGNRYAPPDDESIAAALQLVGYESLHADCSVPAIRKDKPLIYVDLSAFAKGYAVDRLAAILEDHGQANFLVEVGGELRLHGLNASGERWSIAIEKPEEHARAVQTIVHVSDCGMATSGDYRNFFEYHGQRFSHTIDPTTGRPVAHAAAAVTVIRDSAAEADALATALLVLGPDAGLALAAKNGIAAYFLLRTGTGIEERSTGEFAALLN